MLRIRRGHSAFLVLLVLLAAPAPDAAVATPAAGADLPELGEILETMARVADLYRDTALRFTCDETIYYAAGYGSSLHKFKYIYRRSEDGSLLDYRTPRGRAEGHTEKKQARARLEHYGLPTYMNRAYSWLFIFGRSNREGYRFFLEGEGEALGRTAIRVRFEARQGLFENDDGWFGTAWIDRDTYQLIRVEAVDGEGQRQRLNLQHAVDASPEPGSPIERGRFTYTHYTTDFDIEKNGLRFPGKVTITRAEHVVTGIRGKGTVREFPEFTVSQTYKKYRFFGVRTREQINDFLVQGVGLD